MIDKRLRSGFGGASDVWIHWTGDDLKAVDFTATCKLYLGFEFALGVE